MFLFLAVGIPVQVLAQSTDGDALFDVPGIHDVQVTFTQPGFWDSLTAYKPLDKFMMAKVVIDGTIRDSIGIQLKGNSSYNSYPGLKKSMKIAFDEYVSQKFDGLKTLNLNNGFRNPDDDPRKDDAGLLERNGVPAPRCTYARVPQWHVLGPVHARRASQQNLSHRSIWRQRRQSFPKAIPMKPCNGSGICLPPIMPNTNSKPMKPPMIGRIWCT